MSIHLKQCLLSWSWQWLYCSFSHGYHLQGDDNTKNWLFKASTLFRNFYSHYADSRKDWPIDHRPYLPQKWVEGENQRLGKEVYVFKSKLQLGLELVDDLHRRGIQFFHLLVDAWYGNSPDFIKGVESRECLYTTSLYANRRVYFSLPGEKNKEEHSVKDVVTALKEDAFSKTQYIKANGEVRTVYVADMRIRIKNLSVKRRVLIVKPTPKEKDMKNIDVPLI